MSAFQIIGLAVFAGCWWAWSSSNTVGSKFDAWIPYPDAARWTLYIAGGIILLAGVSMGGDGCFIDWDGVSNRAVCG